MRVLVAVVELSLLVQIVVAVRVAQRIRRLVLRQGPATLALLVWQYQPTAYVVVRATMLLLHQLGMPRNSRGGD